jgi:asparagine synthase (glutamine-hydrolysing)
MRLAKEHNVTVLLDGQGADEMLAGYHTYFINYLSGLFYNGRIKEFATELKEINDTVGYTKWVLYALLAPIYNIIPASIRRTARQSFIGSKDYSLIHADFVKTYNQNNNTDKISMNLQHSLWESEVEYSLRELLRYEDKNSMAFSIETRTPFIDYRLVEYVFSLPACYKIHNGWTKFLLRESTMGLVPEAIRLRKDKLGFPAPESIWMRNSRERIRRIVDNKDFKAGRYIDQKKVVDKLDIILAGNAAGTFTPIWPLINLELWLQRMF